MPTGALDEYMAELEAEREMSRSEVATYLRTFAEKLDAGASTTIGDTRDEGVPEMEQADHNQHEGKPGEETTQKQVDTTNEEQNDSRHRSENAVGHDNRGKVTFMVGNESATINPPETVHFEMSVGSDSTILESATSETVEFVLHWNRDDVAEDDELSIR